MKNEFTHVIDLRQVKPQGCEYKLNASKKQLESLAIRFKLPKIEYLRANLEMMPENKHDFTLMGEVEAKVTLTCGITLENFDKVIKGKFSEIFTTKKLNEDNLDFDMDDDIVTEVKDGMVDIAEVVAEQLSLLIPDFPRKEGVSFEFKDEEIQESNPFSVLKNLKK
ncbi:MAG: hypothetical protein BWY78_00107 [Alphaproteobacteria bacterium ADurb.Bin438]|nr:MAG: hypothetical protein BWY78_00107 [Alphaproteobacteria bacterium ADurb.Bin438]